MNKLISLRSSKLDGQTVQTVNARELHAFLEVGRDFSSWIKGRIEQYGFADGVDYVVAEGFSSPNPALSKSRPQRVIDYHLSLDMAKLLCASEGNERGRAALKFMSANSICSIEELYSTLADIDPERGKPRRSGRGRIARTA